MVTVAKVPVNGMFEDFVIVKRDIVNDDRSLVTVEVYSVFTVVACSGDESYDRDLTLKKFKSAAYRGLIQPLYKDWYNGSFKESKDEPMDLDINLPVSIANNISKIASSTWKSVVNDANRSIVTEIGVRKNPSYGEYLAEINPRLLACVNKISGMDISSSEYSDICSEFAGIYSDIADWIRDNHPDFRNNHIASMEFEKNMIAMEGWIKQRDGEYEEACEYFSRAELVSVRLNGLKHHEGCEMEMREFY